MTSSNAIKKAYADTALGQVHYLVAGDVNLPTLVLLHQTPSSSEMFRPLMTILATKFHCIAPDFIGFGGSDNIDENTEHSIELYADGIQQCLASMGITKYSVFGHHTGVSVAAQLAYDNPEQCIAIVFSGPTLLSDELKISLPNLVVDDTLDEAGEFLQRYWQVIRQKDNTVDINLSLRENLLALALKSTYKKAYKAVAEHDFKSIIKQITCPTLVFAGDRDVLKSFVDETVSLLLKGEKADIGDTSTYVCETHPQQVATLIENFCLVNAKTTTQNDEI